MAPKWRVIRTVPRAEYLAAEALGRDGFQIFLPRVQVTIPRNGHTDMPLFPGYIFLRCDAEAEGWPVFRPGHRVLNWVTFGGELPTLPDEFVDDLTHRLEEISRQGSAWRQFRAGEMVRIVSKNLESVAQVADQPKSSQGRVKVLLEFMGRLVPAQVPWEQLQPIDDDPLETRQTPRRTRGGGRWVKGFEPRTAVGA